LSCQLNINTGNLLFCSSLLGGSVSGCIGAAVYDKCVTQPGNGWFSGPPKTIVDPGVEFSFIQDVGVRGFIGHYADFTDTTLTLTIDGTDTIAAASIGRASQNWGFSDITLIPPNRVITGVVLAGQSGLDVTSFSYDSDSILINTAGFSYAYLAGNILSATLNIETSVVPIPAAIWLFGSGLLGLVGIARRKKA